MTRLLPLLILSPLALAGCDTTFAGRSYAAAAIEVVRPVIDDGLTEVQADLTARCITDAASPDENLTLARDLGVLAGTATLALIRELTLRPATQACLMAAGLPQPKV